MHTTKTVSQGLSYTETLRKKGGKYLPVINLICARHCAISVYLLFQDAPFNQSILKEISPECSLEGLMLKLKLQSFGHQMGRTDSFEKTLRLGKIEGKRRRGRERMRWHHRLNNMSLSRFWALVMNRKACHATVHEITRSWTQLSAWAELNWLKPCQSLLGLPGSTSGKESTCQYRRHRRCEFHLWVRKIPWRRKWQPTPVFLPREFHWQKSQVGYSPQGCTELDTTEVT